MIRRYFYAINAIFVLITLNLSGADKVAEKDKKEHGLVGLRPLPRTVADHKSTSADAVSSGIAFVPQAG